MSITELYNHVKPYVKPYRKLVIATLFLTFKVLSYRMAYFTAPDNESGKLQSRIDNGINSLTRLVQNFFIDILPLFANSIVALILMFNANFYVGLVGLCIVPIYFYVSQMQAGRLGGFRRRMRSYRENKSNAIISLIDSITVIKSFVREPFELKKQNAIQYEMTENQMQTRRLSFIFDGAKNFIEQIGVVIIIILTAYLLFFWMSPPSVLMRLPPNRLKTVLMPSRKTEPSLSFPILFHKS